MPHIGYLIMGLCFKKCMATMDLLSLEDAKTDIADEGKGCGSFIKHSKTRRKINMGAKVVSQTSQSEIIE